MFSHNNQTPSPPPPYKPSSNSQPFSTPSWPFAPRATTAAPSTSRTTGDAPPQTYISSNRPMIATPQAYSFEHVSVETYTATQTHAPSHDATHGLVHDHYLPEYDSQSTVSHSGSSDIHGDEDMSDIYSDDETVSTVSDGTHGPGAPMDSHTGWVYQTHSVTYEPSESGWSADHSSVALESAYPGDAPSLPTIRFSEGSTDSLVDNASQQEMESTPREQWINGLVSLSRNGRMITDYASSMSEDSRTVFSETEVEGSLSPRGSISESDTAGSLEEDPILHQGYQQPNETLSTNVHLSGSPRSSLLSHSTLQSYDRQWSDPPFTRSAYDEYQSATNDLVIRAENAYMRANHAPNLESHNALICEAESLLVDPFLPPSAIEPRHVIRHYLSRPRPHPSMRVATVLGWRGPPAGPLRYTFLPTEVEMLYGAGNSWYYSEYPLEDESPRYVAGDIRFAFLGCGSFQYWVYCTTVGGSYWHAYRLGHVHPWSDLIILCHLSPLAPPQWVTILHLNGQPVLYA